MRTSLLPLLILSFSASPAPAQEAAAAQGAKKASAWTIDYGERRCTLLRTLGANAEQTFGVRVVPGSPNYQMIFTNTHWRGNPVGSAEKVDILLRPSGTLISGGITVTEWEGVTHPILMVHALDDKFLDGLASASGIEISAGKRALGTIALSGTAKAVAALRDCTDTMYKSWGMDPGLLKDLQRQPVGDVRSVFSSNDYPADLRRRGISGEVIIRYDIGPAGRITDCTVVGSSGEPKLDQATCDIVRKRAKFEPGLGRDGQPVTVRKIATIVWQATPTIRH